MLIYGFEDNTPSSYLKDTYSKKGCMLVTQLDEKSASWTFWSHPLSPLPEDNTYTGTTQQNRPALLPHLHSFSPPAPSLLVPAGEESMAHAPTLQTHKLHCLLLSRRKCPFFVSRIKEGQDPNVTGLLRLICENFRWKRQYLQRILP